MVAFALSWNAFAIGQFELSSETARDVTADGFAFLEVRTQRATYYAGEPILIELRFGFESEFFARNLVALFRPPMDVPVQLQAAWIPALPGATVLDAEPADGLGQRSFVLNDKLAGARELEETGARIDERKFRVFSAERMLVANHAGQLELPEAKLRFAFAKGFDDSLFSPTANVERVEAFVLGAARTLTILALPEQDRPEGFSGAVGRLTISVEAAPRDIELGSTLQLSLRVRGEGNLESFEAPRLDRLEGWRVNGSLDHKRPGERTIVYDLAAQSERTTSIPSIPFSYFDTTAPAAYRVLDTEPIPVVVRPRISAPTAPEGGVAEEREHRVVWLAAAAGLALTIAVLALLRRRSRSPRRD